MALGRDTNMAPPPCADHVTLLLRDGLRLGDPLGLLDCAKLMVLVGGTGPPQAWEEEEI